MDFILAMENFASIGRQKIKQETHRLVRLHNSGKRRVLAPLRHALRGGLLITREKAQESAK